MQGALEWLDDDLRRTRLSRPSWLQPKWNHIVGPQPFPMFDSLDSLNGNFITWAHPCVELVGGDYDPKNKSKWKLLSGIQIMIYVYIYKYMFISNIYIYVCVCVCAESFLKTSSAIGIQGTLRGSVADEAVCPSHRSLGCWIKKYRFWLVNIILLVVLSVTCLFGIKTSVVK